jgi:hypothetical protein
VWQAAGGGAGFLIHVDDEASLFLQHRIGADDAPIRNRTSQIISSIFDLLASPTAVMG